MGKASDLVSCVKPVGVTLFLFVRLVVVARSVIACLVPRTKCGNKDCDVRREVRRSGTSFSPVTAIERFNYWDDKTAETIACILGPLSVLKEQISFSSSCSALLLVTPLRKGFIVVRMWRLLSVNTSRTSASSGYYEFWLACEPHSR